MYSPSPLLEALDAIRATIESAAHLLLFLDFDGTLAPIAATPHHAQLPPATRAILSQLARRADCTVSIVSGRALDDVRERVGIDDLIYAGNHGLEISGGGLRFDESKAVSLRDDIKAVVDALTTGLGRIPGILVEPKGLSASVHYRLVPDLDWSEVEHVVKAIVPEDHRNFVVVAGKMVWEVRPRVAWNKGTAVRWIRQQLGLMHAVAFYLGDDRTDEDAFAEIGRHVTARVGASPSTLAGYRVADTEEVAAFLGWLAGTGRLA